MNLFSLLNFVLALILAPYLLGVVNRVKAYFAGRTGQPLLQLYFDLAKLVRKIPVYSRTTTWCFQFGPMISLASLFLAMTLISFGGVESVFHFSGDFVFLLYLLGLVRFFTVLAALDTGSSFEGMGASREVQFSALAEPAIFLSLAALVRQTGETSLSKIYQAFNLSIWSHIGPIVALVGFALLIVFLTENARIPVDDPNTHLELTMIHEAMILDHSGIDLAFILYGAALKFWVLGALIVGVVLPYRSPNVMINLGIFLLGMFGLSILVGIIESTMARLRLLKVPHLLLAAVSVAIMALIIQVK